MKLLLTQDEFEILQHTLTETNWTVFEKFLSQLVHNINQKVIKYNLEKGPEGLVIEKARAEGADKLVVDIKSWKDKINKPEKETKNVRLK